MDNEDSCVLDIAELLIIDQSFDIARATFISIGLSRVLEELDIIRGKIKKLNDLTKGKYE